MALKIDTTHAQVNVSKKNKYVLKILREITALKKAISLKYTSPYASINLCDDTKMLTSVSKLAKKYSDVAVVVVVGIGGSNLGTLAVYEALCGKLYNETRNKKVYFLDTVDPQTMHDVLSILQKTHRDKQSFLINIISKSGGTTETIANFEFLFKELLIHNIPVSETVVITTDKNSHLWHFAEVFSIPTLEIPALVGGRYSVLSPVGLFPLAVLDVKISQLLRGAKDIRKVCLHTSHINPALQSAIAIYNSYASGANIHETFVFGTQYESLGKWYRQLMGESLGKEYDLDKKVVWNGITPMTAVGSTDLHSMAQLYLGGPKDKFVSFVVPQSKVDVHLPEISEFDSLVSHIQKKSFIDIQHAILQGIQAAFIAQKRPFSTTTFLKTPSDIGAWLQFKMIEIMFLARLMNVNPFDQPNVEEYKIITKKVLSR